MNDEMLSQEEIDALLKISEQKDNDDKEEVTNKNSSNPYLSDMEIDTIGEIGNISFGSSATALSMLLNQKVTITTPEVTIIEGKDLEQDLTFKPVSVQVDYTKGFTGRNVFVIKAKDASVIADIMLGGDGARSEETLSEIDLSAVQEAMNQMMGTAATSMSTIFNKIVDISPPSIIDGSTNEEIRKVFNEDVYVKVFFRLIVGDLIDSNMVQLIPLSFAKQLVEELMEGDPANVNAVTDDAPAAEVTETAQPPVKEEIPEPVQKQTEPVQQAIEEKTNEKQLLGNPFDHKNSPVEQASFSAFEAPPLSKSEQRNLDMLMDISLQVTVELGRTKKTIKEILELTQGSIIELDKLAGEPVDIFVNDKLIAEGEVVVIEENFGVRITDVISKADRLMKLN